MARVLLMEVVFILDPLQYINSSIFGKLTKNMMKIVKSRI
jgi:hypothetical protein